MEDLAVEVCGKNGAYYKVSFSKFIDIQQIPYKLTNSHITGLREEYSPGSSHSVSSTRVRKLLSFQLVVCKAFSWRFHLYSLHVYITCFSAFSFFVSLQLE